uniref:Ryanodine receptor 44F n=1 Tax=Parastrongyloides trichosuri TaxID=131310 RepID=A0A0N4ZPH7_PARTI
MVEKEETPGGEQDDVSFLRTGDIVALTCVSSNTKDGAMGSERVCLSTEGFANRMCVLENVSDKDVPPDISQCMLYIDNALSVRALQEMMSAENEVKGTGGSGGHKTLLYGHAVQLKHVQSEMYLACLNSCSSSDKLSFDVGVQESNDGETCWWTIHPASKQRSEGEKVRVGDDVILVSVATERYLHMALGKNEQYIVIASFHQTLWNIASVSSGSIRNRNMGVLFGNDVLRLFHGNDECLTIPENWSENQQHNVVIYEGGNAVSQARSLWRVELVRMKWHGAMIGYDQTFRIRHITTGRYLGVVENAVILLQKDKADFETTAFIMCPNKDPKKAILEEKEEEGMGFATIRYGEEDTFIQHHKTQLWLSYQTTEVTKKGLGKVEEKKAVALKDGHMDDCYTFFMALEEESKSARVIRKCSSVLNRFLKGVEALQNEGNQSYEWKRVNLKSVLKLMEDLIEYFAQPTEEHTFEERQVRFRALRSRQDLFQEEGVLNMILDTIDKFSQMEALPDFNGLIGDKNQAIWEEISTYLYLLVAAMIKGNHSNCAQFAAAQRLDWLFGRLSNPQSAEGILDVLYCVLTESPEALNMINEGHIKSVISLLEKVGRDPKVLDVLSSLCEGNGMAVRSSQNTIADHLLPGKDLLLQTVMRDHVSSVMPNILVGVVEGSSLYRKWYFETEVEHIENTTKSQPLLRIGWANTIGFKPYPGSGNGWGCNGCGDDFFSYSYDGKCLWFSGKARPCGARLFKKGDVIGCSLNLTIPEIRFYLNGTQIHTVFRNFNFDGFFFPVMSLSSKVSCRFLFGGDHGKLKYGPPEGFSPIFEAVDKNLEIAEVLSFGDLPKSIYCGTSNILNNIEPFVPEPVDISKVTLSSFAVQHQSQFAQNLHELWAMKKISLGWSYAPNRSETLKTHPCLTSFETLPGTEKDYNLKLAIDTMKTIEALGYHMILDKPPTRMRPIRLPNNFLMSNGYKPQPLDTHEIILSESMGTTLVEALAKNIHNVWAKEKIKRGYTFGVHEVVNSTQKRSPHLVPYENVDIRIKEANKETARETIKVLQLFGIFLECPAIEHDEQAEKEFKAKKASSITYRAEASYAVTSGKWYFEFEVLTNGFMRIGWADISCHPETKVGSDDKSYAFDGYLGKKWHQGAESYGKEWKIGDIVGCFLDLNDRTISFSLNGELLLDPSGSEMAFDNVINGDGFVPCMTLSAGQRARLNFGQESNSLKFFTTCGLQEGYEPFCVNMYRQMPMWYGKNLPMFREISHVDSALEMSRILPTSNTPPCLKLTLKTSNNDGNSSDKINQMEFIRLSLPVKVNSSLIVNNEKQKTIEAMKEFCAASGEPDSDSEKEGKKKKKGLLSAFGRKGRRDSDDERSSKAHHSIGEFDMTETTVAQIQRERLKILHEFGCHSYNNTVLTYLTVGISQREKKIFWKNVLSGKEECGDSHSDSQHDKVSTKSKEKKPGIFKRIRDASHTRQKEKHVEPKKYRTTEILPNTITTVSKRDSSVFVDSNQGSIDVLADMPVSGPGRKSIKRKGSKNATHNKTTGTRGSIISTTMGFEDPNLNCDKDADAEAMKVLGENINDYYYGLRIFPGQDPSSVYVGWVTPQYHSHVSSFKNSQAVRSCKFAELELSGMLTMPNESIEFKNCFLLNAGELLTCVNDTTNTKVTGVLIGCVIDTAAGELSFYVEGQDTGRKFKLEAGLMLYPAAFVIPTSSEVCQFELGRVRYTWPLSAALFKSSSKSLIPYCPPRLGVQVLTPYHWARVPNECLRTTALKLSDVRGWSVLCDHPVRVMLIHIPEKYKSYDILELIEMPELLAFHRQTLNLYCKLASHGNQKVSHILCQHVDEDQVMYAIKNHFLSGSMRQGFHDFLIACHLKTHTDAILSTSHEYVLPLVPELMYKDVFTDDSDGRYPHILGQSVCIRPIVKSDNPVKSFTKDSQVKLLPPSFNFNALKNYVMSAFGEAMHHAVMNCRDLIGGNNLDHFEPLFKLFDNLLIMGLVNDDELIEILKYLHPAAFDENYKPGTKLKGILDIDFAEGVKLQLVNILDHLCDIQLRNRIESLVAFSEGFVGELQQDQCARYMDIKQTDMPPAEAARRTKEFRCPPNEQMYRLLGCKKKEDKEGMLLDDDVEYDQCPMADTLQDQLRDFCNLLVTKCGCNDVEEDVSKIEEIIDMDEETSWVDSLAHLVVSVPPSAMDDEEVVARQGTKNFRNMIVQLLKQWATDSTIESNELIRRMFALLLRQYNGIRELMDGMGKTYVFHERNVEDVQNFVTFLMQIRELLTVQFETTEEVILKRALWQLMNNRIFFQHPDLMRLLKVHENVMTIMMNVLTAQQNTVEIEKDPDDPSGSGSIKDASEMVVACSRFLCYFCRTSRQNQKAMFEHLSFLLDNATMLLARPSLRGSVPLDVAYSSFMDNNELALALKEEELDKVTVYLSRCGLQPNSELIAKEYPDIGWDPLEGERYIDFLRFCVWINGENVEENANLVIRLLIRRPECLGVALKGEGQGLYLAFQEAIALSEDINELENGIAVEYLRSPIFKEHPHYPSKEIEGDDYVDLGASILDFYSSLVDLLAKCAPDPMTLQEGKGDSVRARAILRSLISLDDLGKILALRFKIPNLRCVLDGMFIPKVILSNNTPTNLASIADDLTKKKLIMSLNNEMHENNMIRNAKSLNVIYENDENSGESSYDTASESISSSPIRRAKTQVKKLKKKRILKLREFDIEENLNFIKMAKNRRRRNEIESFINNAGPQPGLMPSHKASVLLFLDRVYGIDSQEMLFSFMEQSFLPDLRAATMMDSPKATESDNALALNRYLCNCVLPLLTNHSHFFADAEHHSALLDATLHTVYRMNRLQSLTKNQRDAVSDFLVAITRELPPAMMIKLLRKVIIDIQEMKENVLVPLRIMTLHYERCNKYYGSGNHYGVANETEKRLSMLLFYAIFDSLGSKPYDPELFGKALPCLTAIGSAISPDYSLTSGSEDTELAKVKDDEGSWSPKPVPIDDIPLKSELNDMINKFAEHFHDSWSARKLEKGWKFAELYSRVEKTHPRLKPFKLLKDTEKNFYKDRCAESIKSLLAWNYVIEVYDFDAAEKSAQNHVSSGTCIQDFNPKPVDLSNMNLEKDMMSAAEKIAENSHNIWCKKIFNEISGKPSSLPPSLVPWDLLTDFERRKNRFHAAEILKFLQYHGYRVNMSPTSTPTKERTKIEGERGNVEKRFAYNLLEKLIQYLEQASYKMKSVKPSQELTRRNSFKKEGQDVKFFEKVVLPMMHAYFNAHKNYFLESSIMVQTGTASNKEKEMVASLFCRLAALLRIKNHAFGSVAKITVKCLQGLTQALDLRTLVKINSDIIRTGLYTFFNNCADDLLTAVNELKNGGQYSLLRGQNLKSWISLEFANQMIIPCLTTMFHHLARHHFGADLLLDDIQASCYKILDSLYMVTGIQTSYENRTSILLEVEKHRPSLGQCLSAFASTFPVAFLEPEFNQNNKYSVLAKSADQSVQVQEMLQNLSSHIPTLENLMIRIEQTAQNSIPYNQAANVYDVDLPLACTYLTYWWNMGENGPNSNQHALPITRANSEYMNRIFCALLAMIRDHIGCENGQWLCRVTYFAVPIIQHVTCDPVKEYLLPIAEKLCTAAELSYKEEERMRTHPDDADEGTVAEDNAKLVRDVYAFFPILMKYTDLHRAKWLKGPSWESDRIYENVAVIFKIWSFSQVFKREELNYMAQFEEDQLNSGGEMKTGKAAIAERKKKRREGLVKKDKHANSIVIACLKRLLPVGLNVFGGRELDIVQQSKEKFLNKENEEKIREFIRGLSEIPVKTDPTDKNAWQLSLYTKIGKSQMRGKDTMNQDAVVEKIANMGQVVAILHSNTRLIEKRKRRFFRTDHPSGAHCSSWKKMLSSQRKRAVVACFRMVPLYGIPSRQEKEDKWKKVLTLQRKRMAISLITASHLYKVDKHRGINFFLPAFSKLWLEEEDIGQDKLVQDLCADCEEVESSAVARLFDDDGVLIGDESTEVVNNIAPDPLAQLIQCFQRAATTEESQALIIASDELYVNFAQVMAKSVHIEEEDDDGGDDDGEVDQAQKEEMAQTLRAEQAVLADRGAAIMCLMYISASNGEPSDMVAKTLQLGIHLLSGGNTVIQKMLIDYLQLKKDVRFFTSIAGLMNNCSVLNLEMFERQIKAEGLGMGAELAAGENQNLNDAEFTCDLFRFLQLTCEGHNLEFQNYLRTQPGHTTSVNLINCIVDYLLRLQESVMDFYWHYSSKEMIDEGGKEYFLRAIQVCSQVFNTLTESIQGPCVGNQMTLANSRLWDAINGFFFLFAHMMEKLYKNSTQLELLREFLNLQKDMIVLMLSMLEGNVLNGAIGKQMVDALVESQQCVEMILKFSDMFLKLKDLTTSQAFQDFDTNKDGWISPKEFQKAMESQKMYSVEEITYLMMCTDVNNDGKVDYMEFTERFHNPARDIGFNLAVLLTNLKEHITSDPRLEKIIEKASTLLEYFDPFLGRIEIMGSSKRVEKIYFEIQESWLEQWSKQQIRDSKNAFLFNVLQDDGGDQGKLEAFINFCEDTIFEMQHAAEISSGDGSDSKMERALKQRDYFLQQTTAGTELTKTMKAGYSMGINAAAALKPENLQRSFHHVSGKVHSMTWFQLIFSILHFCFIFIKEGILIIFTVLTTLIRFLYYMTLSGKEDEVHKPVDIKESRRQHITKPTNPFTKDLPDFKFEPHHEYDAFGVHIPHEDHHNDTNNKKYTDGTPPPDPAPSPTINIQTDDTLHVPENKSTPSPSPHHFSTPGSVHDSQSNVGSVQYLPLPLASPEQGPIVSNYEPKIAEIAAARSRGSILNMLARNFKTIEKMTLYLAFFINVILLFHRVDITSQNEEGGEVVETEEVIDDDDNEATNEFIYITGLAIPYISYEITGWVLSQVLYWLSVFHAFCSFALLISFYQLKIPLITFKREKEVARKLMFDGCWITEDNTEEQGFMDTITWYLDRIVIVSKSFPMKYWDKFVRRKTKVKYKDQVDEETLNKLLGEERAPGDTSFDYRYNCWLWFGVILTNAQFLYRVGYLICSTCGVVFSPFFYAFHLIDVVLSFPMLKAILQSVTHNLQQLILTIMMTLVVVYLYTVLAFNFFRKFYVQEGEDGEEPDRKCHNMLTCFIYHFYAGVRAGGGIADEIESPYGDEMEYPRMLYDISFFFFVIVILLAIMQGLIIDAFGELRDQQEAATEKLESSCFICDIGKETFDRMPRGFEIHTTKEHNFANYLFFLQHLVNKDETEYTGQETYVREKYDNRDWEFFPVGECFMKQYEDQLLQP